MDHLPVPENPTFRLEIPYLCTEIYDGGPLATYPQRHGWELMYVSNRLDFKRHGNIVSGEDIAAFLQTWLYFGLLSETLGLFGPDVQTKFVVEGSQGQKILTSRYLEGMVLDWAERLTVATPEIEQQSARTTFEACWNIIFRVVNFTHQHKRMLDEDLEPDVLDHHQLIALSSLFRGVSLVLGRFDRPNIEGHHSDTFSAIGFTTNVSCVLLRKHMEKSNWCPSDICRIFGTIPHEALWYYANMRPPRESKDHSKCPDHLCNHTQIDSMCVYTLAHTKPDCPCKLIHASRKTLQDILLQGNIPVIEPVISDSSLKVVSNLQRPYIAISHIWAEGLGDPEDNALHSCELERLFQLVERLPTCEGAKPALWIDTICVPLGDLQNLAIERMRETYQKATGVLVLDAYLQNYKGFGCDPLELLARINNSSWMQRLWTLQEGRLAKRLWFQFADGPVDVFDIFYALFQTRRPFRAASGTDSIIMTSYRASKISPIDQLEETRKPLYTGIHAVREAVMSRAVSQSSDEPLCLAFLMDLDVKPIVSAPEEKKMETFWKQITKIPVSLIFSKAPRKLDTLGFHWAPRSFCGPISDDVHGAWGGSAVHLRNIDTARATEKGLLVDLPGVLFRPVNSPKGWSIAFKNTDMYTFCTSNNLWFMIRLQASWGCSPMTERPENMTQPVALILARLLDSMKSGEDRLPENNKVGGLAVVSKLVDIHNDVFYVNGLQHARIIQVDHAFSLIYTASLRAAESLWETEIPVTKRTNALQYGGGRTETLLRMYKAVANASEQPDSGECSHHILVRCYKLAEAAMSDGELLTACLQTGLWAGYSESDRPKLIKYFIAVMMHDCFIEGYNKAEVLGPLQKWCVD